jgi:hypothetical protein
MKTYAFRTKEGDRFEVFASNSKSALNKVKSIPYALSLCDGAYFQYDKDGFHNWDDGWEYFEVEE